ncbi:hypothetical protein PHPALM_28101 [Phytophthora palmivora]|uniref:Uncharacterized protein n=1 Tax=Phytophthora palmivora TaxID=4796 RepID=A0A2P4XB05_9STRA|nr:hypothetical protein PHPALM_28101 [Phytophthora palmivora]
MQNIHQPVFEFVQAPKLVDWSQDAVVSWKKRWDQYVRIVRQRCTESGERMEIALRPVKACIDSELLEVLCLYELRKAVDDGTREELVTLIDVKLGSVKNNQVPDLDDFFRQVLKIDLHEDDVDARVLKYYRDFATLIKENGLSKILGVGDPADSGYSNRMKLRCTILIYILEPKMLQDDVRRYVKYECREAKCNDFMLFGIIKDKARAQHKYYVLAHERKVIEPLEQGKKRQTTATSWAPSPHIRNLQVHTKVDLTRSVTQEMPHHRRRAAGIARDPID